MINKIKVIIFVTIFFVVFYMSISIRFFPPSTSSKQTESFKPDYNWEFIEPTKLFPEGKYIVKLQDVTFEVPQAEFNPGVKNKPYMNILMIWNNQKLSLYSLAKSEQVTSNGKTLPDNEFGSRFMFRIGSPSNLYSQIDYDYTKLRNHKESEYVLQPSHEFPDVFEYYLLKLKKSFQFLLDYTDKDSQRVVKTRISCIPGFRDYGNNEITNFNSQCRISFQLSEYVTVNVKFDSRIMPQIRIFEAQAYEFIQELIIQK